MSVDLEQLTIDNDDGRVAFRLPLLASHVAMVGALWTLPDDGPLVSVMLGLAAAGGAGAALLAPRTPVSFAGLYGFALPFVGVFGAAVLGGELQGVGLAQVGVLIALGIASGMSAFVAAYGAAWVRVRSRSSVVLGWRDVGQSFGWLEKVYGGLAALTAGVVLILQLLGGS